MIITWTVHCYLEVHDHYLNCRLPNSSSRLLLELSISTLKLSISTKTVDYPNKSCWSPLKLSIAKFKLLLITWTVDCQLKTVDHHLKLSIANLKVLDHHLNHLNCRFPHKTINQDLNWNCRLPNSSCWSPLKLSIAKLKLLIITWTVDWYLKLLIITWTVHCYLEVLDQYLNCRLPNSSCRSLLELSIST